MKRRGRGPITTSSKAARPSPFPGRDFLNMEMKHAATIFKVVEDLNSTSLSLVCVSSSVCQASFYWAKKLQAPAVLSLLCCNNFVSGFQDVANCLKLIFPTDLGSRPAQIYLFDDPLSLHDCVLGDASLCRRVLPVF